MMRSGRIDTLTVTKDFSTLMHWASELFTLPMNVIFPILRDVSFLYSLTMHRTLSITSPRLLCY